MHASLRLPLPLVLASAMAGGLLSLLAAEATAKQTVRVPMPDGIRLATDIYQPSGQGPFPVILARTPYNKDAGAGLGADGTRRGFVVVVQDTRGRFASEGENMPFEADGWDRHADGRNTVLWLTRQPWCNGRIGTWGGSAVGITQLLMAGAGTAQLTAQHITVGAPSLYHDCVYPGGIFKQAMIEDWLRISKFSSNALTLWTSHPVHDAYWRQRELQRRYALVNAPAVHIGGWFDIFAQGTLDAFNGYQRKGGPRARGQQRLLMGPWTHGVLQEKAGDLTFPHGKKPPTTFHDTWAWFAYQLQGETNVVAREPRVTYYTMGDVDDPTAPGNTWRTADQWPPLPAKLQRYFLQSDRRLATSTPTTAAPVGYDYDPARPAPTIGGLQLTLPAGPKDQRLLESRSDVLAFSSDTLSEPLEVTGRVRARLWIASDAPDTDFFVKLCDVYPDGRSFNICEGQLRARFRRGFDRERFLPSNDFDRERSRLPSRVVPLDIDLGSTSMVFNRGHRLRALITSSSVPGFDPNPNTGDGFRANDRRRVARNLVYVDPRHPSHLLLPVVQPTPASR